MWATDLSLGWIELKERGTDNITRTDFGDCTLISISEKMSAAGKRILLGLDAPGGVPVDIYLICGPKEIQLTVEASRDSKTHLLERVGLLPGLCRANKSDYLVIPHAEGMMLRPEEFTDKSYLSHFLHVWDASLGLAMPFIGAVSGTSALALLTDSAYGGVHLIGGREKCLCANWIYGRDPERRRLDMRIIALPNGDHVRIARAYREKLINERNHVTLRKKMRDRPALAEALDALWVPESTASEILEELGILKRVQPKELSVTLLGETQSKWNEMEDQLQNFSTLAEEHPLLTVTNNADWLAHAVEGWEGKRYRQKVTLWGRPLPLMAVVYHDAVISVNPILWSNYRRHDPWPQQFLRALLTLSAPSIQVSRGKGRDAEQFSPDGKIDQYRAIAALLGPLHALAFPAFLTAHKFLTPDFLVEEAYYSDKTYVLINQSETEEYETVELCLPPGGFYVRHAQFEAHDALRVGTVNFPTRAWRMRRSLDGKPLEQSQEIEEKDFLVVPPPGGG